VIKGAQSAIVVDVARPAATDGSVGDAVVTTMTGGVMGFGLSSVRCAVADSPGAGATLGEPSEHPQLWVARGVRSRDVSNAALAFDSNGGDAKPPAATLESWSGRVVISSARGADEGSR